MEIINYFETTNQEHWKEEIKKSDWVAGAFLYELLSENKFKNLLGETSKLLLLTDGEKLAAFCTYAERDEIEDPTLTPWVGFVYTFPEYRGGRRMGLLLDRAYELAKEEGHEVIYISTGEEGLYEKYGYTYWQDMTDWNGGTSRVYRRFVKRFTKKKGDADELFRGRITRKRKEHSGK